MEHARNPAACREICEYVGAARAIGCRPTGLADGLARIPALRRHQTSDSPHDYLWVPRSPPAGGDSASGNLSAPAAARPRLNSGAPKTSPEPQVGLPP